MRVNKDLGLCLGLRKQVSWWSQGYSSLLLKDLFSKIPYNSTWHIQVILDSTFSGLGLTSATELPYIFVLFANHKSVYIFPTCLFNQGLVPSQGLRNRVLKNCQNIQNKVSKYKNNTS